MVTLLFICAYFCAFSFVLGFMPMKWESRPTLEALGMVPLARRKKKKISSILLAASVINKPLCRGPIRARLSKELAVARVNLSPEEFFLVKEIGVCLILFISYPSVSPDFIFGWIAIGFADPTLKIINQVKHTPLSKKAIMGVCPNCNVNIDAKAQFCQNCGGKIEE